MEVLRRPRLTIALAPAIGVAMAVVTAASFLVMAQWRLEAWVLASGIPAVIAAAEPPLGFNARLVLALICGAMVGGVAWFALFVVIGGRTLAIGPEVSEADDAVPVLRRADAHPDAPPRAPLFANRDLGMPFLDPRQAVGVVGQRAPIISTEHRTPIDDDAAPASASADGEIDESHTEFVAETPVTDDAPPVDEPRPLPADLDQPLAAYDPSSFAAAAPAARPERLETFELTPVVRSIPDTVPAPSRRGPRDTEATISALLERLERGIAKRDDGDPAEAKKEGGLAATLESLRKLAR